MKAGVKNIGTVFLMTDAQVSDEKFLVLINDLLASGEIPDLFPDDEVENIIGGKWHKVIYLLEDPEGTLPYQIFLDLIWFFGKIGKL